MLKKIGITRFFKAKLCHNLSPDVSTLLQTTLLPFALYDRTTTLKILTNPNDPAPHLSPDVTNYTISHTHTKVQFADTARTHKSLHDPAFRSPLTRCVHTFTIRAV